MLDKIEEICNEALYGVHHKNTMDAMCEMHHALKTIRDLLQKDDPSALGVSLDNLINQYQEKYPISSVTYRVSWRGFANILTETLKEVKNELSQYPG